MLLASSLEVERVTGRFFEQRRGIPCQFRNMEAEQELQAVCEELAGQ